VGAHDERLFEDLKLKQLGDQRGTNHQCSGVWPRRPSLMRLSVSVRNASFWKNGRVIGVSMKVGASVLTRIL
jgi:hypothetical protein